MLDKSARCVILLTHLFDDLFVCPTEGMLKMPNYIEELRKRGLSLRKFAKLVDLSPEWVSKIFRGDEEPSADAERRIQDALEHCPWCGSDWPGPTTVEGKPSVKPKSTAKRAS